MGLRGSKATSDRDWLIGARPRRLLLHALLVCATPDEGWPVRTLTAACEVGERGLDRHLRRLERLDLARRDGSNWRPVEPRTPLANALAELLTRLEDVSDDRPASSHNRPSARPRIVHHVDHHD
ncbi:MAG TPA: hypothetical protein VGW75_17735 [Solirubrobacteraceae bacterium]|jgi:DNA-binding HxlR family transcriptional regulator|nr:hypothetical protein [Solirubrobacteraceae bacterium]